MAFDCYVVRLSFDLKDGRAARANGAYADSTTKTKGFNQFFKLCFCAGERRGEQNTHGSDKKTHATKLSKTVFWGTLGAFFRSRQPSRKKVPKVTSQSPSGTTPGTRQEGEIGLLVALGAFQGRFWTPKGGPNGTQNCSKIDLGAQGPPKSAQEPPGGPKRPPREARIRGPPRPTSTRKSYTKILVKQDPPTILGSVAGIGGAAPLEIRPLSL